MEPDGLSLLNKTTISAILLGQIVWQFLSFWNVGIIPWIQLSTSIRFPEFRMNAWNVLSIRFSALIFELNSGGELTFQAETPKHLEQLRTGNNSVPVYKVEE